MLLFERIVYKNLLSIIHSHAPYKTTALRVILMRVYTYAIAALSVLFLLRASLITDADKTYRALHYCTGLVLVAIAVLAGILSSNKPR